MHRALKTRVTIPVSSDPVAYYFGPIDTAVPCSSFPGISLNFRGTSFPVAASALNLCPVSAGSSDCVSGIVALDVGFCEFSYLLIPESPGP